MSISSLKPSRGWGRYWLPFFLGVLVAYIWAHANMSGIYVFAPLCSWRFVANFDSWNVALPDRSCIYQVMFMYMEKGDEFRLTSESLPYARYFSFQTYAFSHYKSDGTLRDVDIVPENGPNAYRDLAAAARGEKQGGYTVHITADGSGNYTNVLRAFGDEKERGYFFLFFRIYDLGDQPHPEAPWAHRQRGGSFPPEQWGWTPPPKVEVKRGSSADWTEIPMCTDKCRTTTGYKLLDWVQDYLPVAHPTPGRIRANLKNNVYLPTLARRYGTFDNREARYLGAAADAVTVNSTATSNHLWARIEAHLPRTPGSLYEAPYIANTSAWEVRYVSFTSFSRALPLRSYDTVSDRAIRRHYAHVSQWDGRFTLWVGPPGAPVPEEATLEQALVMRWGERQVGGVINYPGYIYRQLMTRSQMEGWLEGGHHSGIANLIPDQCLRGNETASLDTEGVHDEACCGFDPPRHCHKPEYLQRTMREYYPQTTYHLANTDLATGQVKLSPVHV